MIPANNSLFPALYLYPLNDTWHPKHISLTNQRTKIGRQTSSKTAPGERNGFFDSKVLSRQHAEVWEEGGKIYIKDVKSSNGTFINGERLSSEGHESEPFELKSDDIVEFGIDIVGEDNKTIIHHKVAARVVCVFSEQDAQVAARAEAHQQQQQQQQQVLHQHQQQQQQHQQQQYMQQAHAAAAVAVGSQGSMAHAGPSGINAPSSVTQGQPGVGAPYAPFAAVQRRAQLAQQGLGGMGGLRTPGSKTGLSFDVILSRLQGELQKSKQTGHELDTLTGAMHVIQDTLGGSLPGPLPPFPANLPPVRPPQEAPQVPAATSTTDGAAVPIATAPPSVAVSPEQPPAALSAAASAAAVIDLQSQLRETQSSLSTHLDKVRALEGVLAEQEAMKREVRTLREMMEEGRLGRDGVETTHHQHSHIHDSEEPRGGFDIEDDEDREASDDDSDYDTRSISTVVPHELAPVDEEDEEQMAEEERRGREDKLLEAEKQEDLLESEEEERERRREDLGLGRPRTPEPTRMGLDYPSLLSTAPRRASITSPLSQQMSSSEDVYDQVQKLSKQVSTVMALTTTLEAQHSAAQVTIQALESKVEALEGMLKTAEEALKAKSLQEEEAKEIANQEVQVMEEEEKKEEESLTSMLAEWKKSVEGQWGYVQEEWKEERARLNKARDEWEAKLGAALASVTAHVSTNVDGSSSSLVGNGDVFKHNGLVTPPSPRSQSSISPRFRRRRRRPSSSSPTGQRGRSTSPFSDGEADPDTDATLANSDEASSSSSPRAYSPELIRDMEILKEKHFVTTDGTKSITAIAAAGLTAAAVSATGINMQVQKAARTLATPEPSVYKLSTSMAPMGDTSLDPGAGTAVDDNGSDPEHSSSSSTPSSTGHPKNFVSQQDPNMVSTGTAGPSLNFHAAIGVLVLSVAAAAVFWKVKPE